MSSMVDEIRDELLSLIPELAEIKDEALREGVVDCFIIALNEGGYKPEDMDRMPFTLQIENCPVSLLEHMKGVLATSLAIARTMETVYGPRVSIDRDALIAGALLHDVGKLIEYAEEEGEFIASDTGMLVRHNIIGAQIAREAGLPIEVSHIIAYHSIDVEITRRTTEAYIVHISDYINSEVFK